MQLSLPKPLMRSRVRCDNTGSCREYLITDAQHAADRLLQGVLDDPKQPLEHQQALAQRAIEAQPIHLSAHAVLSSLRAQNATRLLDLNQTDSQELWQKQMGRSLRHMDVVMRYAGAPAFCDYTPAIIEGSAAQKAAKEGTWASLCKALGRWQE